MMKQWTLAAVLAVFVLSCASAQDAPPISAAEFQRITKFLDTVGAKTKLAPPTLQSLGLSSDPSAEFPVVSIKTDDSKVYFSRSQLDPNDYVLIVRGSDNTHSYMFLTHADLRPVRGLYLATNDFPKDADVSSPKVRAVYKDALIALAKDADRSKLP